MVSGPDLGRAGFAELDGPFHDADDMDLDAEQPRLAAVDQRLDEHQAGAPEDNGSRRQPCPAVRPHDAAP